MSLSLRALLYVSGLVACSHTAPAAQGPSDAPARRANASEEAVAQPAAYDQGMAPLNPGSSPSGAQSDTLPPQPDANARATGTETKLDSDPGLQQRIRRAAMADGLL